MRLLDQVRDAIRRKHNSIRTEQAYVGWIENYILFHRKRHPKNMREQEIPRDLSHLASRRKDSKSGAQCSCFPLQTGPGN